MAKLTVNNIFEDLESTMKDISDVGISQKLRIANMLNQEIYELNKSIKPDDTFTEYTFSTTVGTKRYSLPADFEECKALGCGLFILNPGGDIYTEVLEGYVGGDDGYYIGSEIISLVNTPSLYLVKEPASVQTYLLRYTKTLPELTSLADETILDKRFLQLTRDYVLKEYALYDRDFSAIRVYSQMLSNSMQEYIETSSRTPGVYSLK